MVSFRIDTKLLDKLNMLKESKTDVIHKALEMYLRSSENVNTSYKESVNTECNTHVNTHKDLSEVNQVHHKVQVTENHELIEYLKRDNEWLKDRIEHFEYAQDRIFAKVDAKPKSEKTAISWVQM